MTKPHDQTFPNICTESSNKWDCDTLPTQLDEFRKDTTHVAKLQNQVEAKLRRKDAAKLPKHHVAISVRSYKTYSNLSNEIVYATTFVICTCSLMTGKI